MTSEIRTNSLKSRAGLSTVTMTDSGPMFSGITTFVDNSTFSVGTGGTIHAPATNTLNIGVNNTESLRIDSNSNLKVAGIVTATHFHGDGSNLTGITQTTINNNANNRIITGSGTANTLVGESTLTYDNPTLEINTDTSPYGVLNLNGNSGGLIQFEDNEVTKWSIFGDSTFSIYDNSNSSTRLRITSGGKFGFGTSSPYTYGVATFNDSNGIVLEGSSQGRLLFRHTGGGTNLKMFDLASSDGVMKFRTIADNGTTVTERLLIKSDGNVVIKNHLAVDKTGFETLTGNGVNAKLQVNVGSNDYDGILLGGGYNRSTITTGGNYDLVYTSNAYPANATSNGHRFLCGSDGGGGPHERLRIRSDGDTTISASATSMFPDAALNIVSDKNVETGVDDKANYHLALVNPNNDTGEAIGIAFGITDTTTKVGAAIVHERDAAGSQGSLKFFTRPSNAGPPVERLRINSGGAILTAQNGTPFSWPSNPGHIMYSNGEYRSTSTNGTHIRCNRMNGDGHVAQWYRGQTNMVGYISITSSGTGYGSGSSDERTKKNIEAWDENILDKFKSLTPKKFNFNWEDDSVSKHKGYIAQNEFEKFPEAYPKNNLTDCDNEYHMFVPTDMTVYLMKGLKEAAEKIEQLEQENIALRVRVTNLEGN